MCFLLKFDSMISGFCLYEISSYKSVHRKFSCTDEQGDPQLSQFILSNVYIVHIKRVKLNTDVELSHAS